MWAHRCSVKSFSVRTVPFKKICCSLSRSCNPDVETGECISMPCAVQEASRDGGGGLLFLWNHSSLASLGQALGTMMRRFWGWISKVSLGSPLIMFAFPCGCPSRSSSLHVSPAPTTVILNLLLNLYLFKSKIQNVSFLINTIFWKQYFSHYGLRTSSLCVTWCWAMCLVQLGFFWWCCVCLWSR